jgi:CheY-like chemotaxis protein
MQVLVVDDMKINRSVAIRLLQKAGCTVDVVCDGREAVDAVRHKHFDLVFMDCEMPVMNGFAAAAEIRKLEASGELAERTPIVAMTGHVFATERQRCFDAGMDDILHKPVKFEYFNDMVRKYAAKQQALDVPLSATPEALPTTLTTTITLATPDQQPPHPEIATTPSSASPPHSPDTLQNNPTLLLPQRTTLRSNSAQALQTSSVPLHEPVVRRPASLVRSRSQNNMKESLTGVEKITRDGASEDFSSSSSSD